MPTQPGMRFVVWREPQAPEPASRMDVAGFVGFAASGPINLPVRLEGERAFTEIFGADLDLTWDRQEGRVHRTLLGSAVRAFFRNGGKSCWVVRVAGKSAVSGRFQVPGLAAPLPEGGFAPAVLQAASPGSWSDEWKVGATLCTAGLSGASYQPDGWLLRDQVKPGDLLRLSRQVSGQVWKVYLGADSVRPADDGRGGWLVTGPAFWFTTKTEAPGPTVQVHKSGAASQSTGGGRSAGAWRRQSQGGRLWELVLPYDREVLPGTVLGLSDEREQMLFTVAAVTDATAEDESLLGSTVARKGERLMVAAGRPPLRPVPPGDVDEGALDGRWGVERLTLDLWAEGPTGERRVASDLGFHPASARYLGFLPTDDQLFASNLTGTPQPDGAPAWEALASSVSSPRFPLAALPGDSAGYPLYLPLALDTAADPLFRPQGALRNPRPALERDGLKEYATELFVAPDLAGLAGAELERAVAARQPEGIHALWPIDEVTLVSVPDAVHLGWQARPRQGPADSGTTAEASGAPAPGLLMAPKRQPEYPAPQLERPRSAGPGPYTLRWSDVGAPRYVLQVFRHEWDLAPPAEYLAESCSHTIWWDGKGRLRLRVAARPAGEAGRGPWSNTVTLREPDRRFPYWYLAPDPESLGSANAFVTKIHTALLRMAAARGDIFAVLALPREFSPQASLAYVQNLVRSMRQSGDTEALSFGALYTPWLVVKEMDGSTAPAPPDGAAAGQIAGRALTKGAWVAPANLPLTAVAALDRIIDGEPRRHLFDAQVNVYTAEMLGFVDHQASTLSVDPNLTSIGTRRLLSLVRRILVDAAMSAVFQPDDRRHRAAVQGQLQQALADLFRQGALAGDTASQAYQVVADDTVNPPGSVNAGRLIVDVRVAPARSLTYLTIRLFENQDGRPVVTEGSAHG
jgi:hypothetical protein